MKAFIFLTMLAIANTTWGWGDIGHGAVGEIAERNLTPAGKALVFSIVGTEPLAISATWPDHVRSDSRFAGFNPYHFFEIPQGFNYASLPLDKRADKDADTIIQLVPELLVSPDISRDQKMILFRYLVHIVGDVHQPLHIGNGTDMGANLCDVRWTNPQSNQVQDTNLHSVWDDSLIQNIAHKTASNAGGVKRWFGYKELADLIVKEHSEDFDKVTKASPGEWYQESRDLHDKVYPDAEKVEDPAQRTYCKKADKRGVFVGNYDKNKVPLLDEAYVEKSIPIIKKQILKAGYRLAAVINKTAESAKTKLEPAKDIIAPILLKNSQQRMPQSGKNKKDKKK